MRRVCLFVVGLLLSQVVVAGAQVNSLNNVDYREGEVVDIVLRVLNDDALVEEGVSCKVSVFSLADDEYLLVDQDMTFVDAYGYFSYSWVPVLTFWDGVRSIWNPSVGDYSASVICTGGASLNMSSVTDVIEIRVVD